MFKKLIILVLISLLVLTAATACSSKATEEAVPPANAATEQKPATSNTPTAPTATSEPQTTPETTPATTSSEKEYKKGDAIVVSGEITLIRDLEGNDFSGSSEAGKSLTSEAFLLKPDPDVNPSWYNDLRVYLKKPAKLKLNSKVTVEGIVGGSIVGSIKIIDAVIR
jgi:cytoskeletal protein RodZ